LTPSGTTKQVSVVSTDLFTCEGSNQLEQGQLINVKCGVTEISNRIFRF